METKEEEIEWILKCKSIMDLLLTKKERDNIKSEKDLIKLIKRNMSKKEFEYTALQFILKMTIDYAEKIEKDVKDDNDVMFR